MGERPSCKHECLEIAGEGRDVFEIAELQARRSRDWSDWSDGMGGLDEEAGDKDGDGGGEED